MVEVIPGSLYTKIKDKLSKQIDTSKLPLYGEKEIYKITAERYGKVKIRLDVETDIEVIKSIENYQDPSNKKNFYTYNWEVEEEKLPRDFERHIKPEILEFINILSVFGKNNEDVLRFSIVDGDYKNTEKPGHRMAVHFALIELFNQL